MFGYSFILTDIHWQPAVWIEHFHRHRAQIEERLKDAKLGQALRHLPSGDEHANRVWLTSALLALNLTALCCDLCPAAGASGKAPADAPLRRAAKTLRNLLFNDPRADRAHRPTADPPPARRLPPPPHPPRPPSTRSTRSDPDLRGPLPPTSTTAQRRPARRPRKLPTAAARRAVPPPTGPHPRGDTANPDHDSHTTPQRPCLGLIH